MLVFISIRGIMSVFQVLLRCSGMSYWVHLGDVMELELQTSITVAIYIYGGFQWTSNLLGFQWNLDYRLVFVEIKFHN